MSLLRKICERVYPKMEKLVIKKKCNLLIVQRVITEYRYELLDKLSPYFESIKIISSYGEGAGAAKASSISSQYPNVSISWLRAIKFPYKGESRSWSFFIYPQSVFHVLNADVILLEGTTNLINNMYLVPFSKLMGKKIIWWDAGYSPAERTTRRVKIDKIVSKFMCMTDNQIAYCSSAKVYMEKYMRAENCSVVLNTISTTYFKEIKQEIIESVKKHQLDHKFIKLLYVGAIEKRKKVLELTSILNELGDVKRKFHLTVVGDGDHLEACKLHIKKNDISNVVFASRIYDKEELKDYYFSADLFVMPGDGGLAIAQSLLFGLPAVCVAADGTERDYIDNGDYILDSLGELASFLKVFTSDYSRESVLASMDRLKDRDFISSMAHVLSGN